MRMLFLVLLACGFTACAAEETSSRGLGFDFPGSTEFSAELRTTLQTRWDKRSADYEPRTRNKTEDGRPIYTNRLFLETSPYLQQHAHNPVNWYPWGDEAFAEAKRRGVPVLVSIGYSTCHWCHVMEEESFDNPEIAKIINENYVAIKVDREERPDVDSVYMSAVQVLTGRGGWPLNVWLTADREPFFGGTYFPPHTGDRGSRKGFVEWLVELKQIYDQSPDEVVRRTEGIASRLAALQPKDPQKPGPEILTRATDYFRSVFDPVNGGRKGKPKFPSSFPPRFLLTRSLAPDGEPLQAMATTTLRKMAAGGIYDQAGGGFHRYTVDAGWQVPHFEKMLYDNALLTVAYLDGWQTSGDPFFRQIAEEILRYVGRDMTAPGGAFYSATDADSLDGHGEMEEGVYFTWTPAELKEVLKPAQLRIAIAWWDVTETGNFEGRNILHTTKSEATVAAELKMKPQAFHDAVEEIRDILYEKRKVRAAPLRDEKILASWNGLMISAFAQAGLRLGNVEYVQAAERAADYMLTSHFRKDGGLWRVSRDGEVKQKAYLDDYAFLTAGLLDLYEADGNPRWYRAAKDLEKFTAEQFEDKEGGAFYTTGKTDHEELLYREKPDYDGAIPTGNSVQARNLLRLYAYTADETYRVRAERLFRALGGRMNRAPAAVSELLLALDFQQARVLEVVLVVPKGSAKKKGGVYAVAAPMLDALRDNWYPHLVLSVVEQGPALESLAADLPLVEQKKARKGKTTAYVCEKGVCQLPTIDAEVFAGQLESMSLPLRIRTTGE